MEVFLIFGLAFLIGYFVNLISTKPVPIKQPYRPPRQRE
jgi:hypothetical protein